MLSSCQGTWHVLPEVIPAATPAVAHWAEHSGHKDQRGEASLSETGTMQLICVW